MKNQELSEQFLHSMERMAYRIREVGEAYAALSTKIGKLQDELALVKERFAALDAESKETP